MSRAEVARRLLALGPLTPAQFRAITRWPAKTCRNTLHGLQRAGRACRVPGGLWSLSDGSRA